MDNYIKQSDAIREAIKAADESDDGSYVARREDLIADYINDIPAADVRENVRGEWIPQDYENYAMCSNCKHVFNLFQPTNFCPNCGADMRGKSENQPKEDGFSLFDECRNRLWKILGAKDMEYCKSYEGAIELTYEYDNYFESEEPPENASTVRITLHCYVLGNGRHHEFCGHTLKEAAERFSEWLDDEEEKEYARKGGS